MIQLHNTPPPLPSDEAPATGFGKVAAWLGVLLPVFIVALAVGYGYWLKQQNTPAEQVVAAMTLLGMAAFFFTFVGLCCSIVSFLGHGEDRHGGWIAVGMLGVLLNGGMIGSGVVGGLRAVKARSTDGLRAAMQEFNQRMKQDFETTGTVEYDPEKLNKVVQSLDEVAGSGDSKDARIARAIKSFLIEIDGPMQGLQQEGAVLVKMEPMNPLTLKTRADLQIRQSALNNYLKRNTEVRLFVEDAKSVLREQLRRAGLEDREIAPVLESFWAKFEPRQELLLGIRDCDRRVAESMAAALEIYDQHWQQWRADEQGEFAGLDDADATQEVFRLTGEIQKAAAEQAELQGQYFKSL